MEENNDGSFEKLLGSTSEKSGGKKASAMKARRAGIVTARGTADGLVIRVDGRVEESAVEPALREFLIARQGFLKGGSVHLEWVGASPGDNLRSRVSRIARDEFGIEVLDAPSMGGTIHQFSLESDSKRVTERETGDFSREGGESGPLSLFDGIGAVEFDEASHGTSTSERAVGHLQQAMWDDPDARIVYGTLRSGQKVESDHSLVIFGDVNSGAELVAGGDIIVLGTLRGVAHAGAYDETGGGRLIFALDLQPTQLRIGTVISRGTSEGTSKGPELARVEGDIVVVESYPVKQAARRSGVFGFLRS